MDSVSFRNRLCIFLILCVVLFSCSESEDPVISLKNEPPSNFTVNVLNVQQNSADINWTQSIDPEESLVFYDVFLGTEKIIDNTKELNLQFNELDEKTEYSGKVVASDPEGNEVVQSFNFTTLENGVPSNFFVQVNHVDHTYTKVSWSESVDPEGSEVRYQIALNDSILVEDFSEREFFLPELKGLTTYTVIITASDGDEKQTVIEQTFTTQTKVFNSDVHFENQYELNEFGNKGYNRIEGDLIIGSTLYLTDITDLNPLSTITYLRGNLTITRTACQNLNGLENINDHWYFTEIKVYDNQELLNIDGLIGIENPYYIFINNNKKLLNIEGLSNITGIIKECTISGNHSLLNIKGLRNLTNTPRIEINRNGKIVDLSGLEKITSVSDGIYIYYNEQLISLKGLENFRTGGALNLDGNPNLYSLDDLNSLESVRSLEITKNPLLTNLHGLENLTEVTLALRLNGNTGLTSLEGLENVQFKNNDRNFYYLSVNESPLITNLAPLENYSIPSGNIAFSQNSNLFDLCGIAKLAREFNDEIGDSFSIRFNAYNPSRQNIIDGNCKQ